MNDALLTCLTEERQTAADFADLLAEEQAALMSGILLEILPAIVERKKHGFAVPIGALIRTLFRERCRDVLLSRANPVADWFERAAIEALIDEHQSGRHDHGKKLWALYILFCVAGRSVAPAAAPAAHQEAFLP